MPWKKITVIADTQAVLRRTVEVDDKDNNPAGLARIAHDLYCTTPYSQYSLDIDLDWEYLDHEVAHAKGPDDQPALSGPCDPALTAILLKALQDIIDINGSSGGPEGLVAEFKDIARLAVAQYEDASRTGEKS